MDNDLQPQPQQQQTQEGLSDIEEIDEGVAGEEEEEEEWEESKKKKPSTQLSRQMYSEEMIKILETIHAKEP